MRPAGVVENPVTLYPTQPRRRATRASGKPIDWNKIKAGDVFGSSVAPAIAGKPFRIECTIEAKTPSGIILAHGGSAVGYALYAKEANIVFAVRHSSNEIQRVACSASDGKPIKILAGLGDDGALYLSLNDAEAFTGKSRGLLASHPMEDFCLGHDNRNPLDDQAPNQRFNGKISAVRVVVGYVAK